MKRTEYLCTVRETAYRYTPENAIFLDIETTGLKKETALLTVIGCGYYEEDGLHILQWFNDDAVSEEEMLREFLSFYEKKKGKIITYHGEQFDLPFLKLHILYNDLDPSPIEKFDSLDLYTYLRGYAKVFGLENSKQSTWEQFLGLCREDSLSGVRLVTFYKEYLRSKDNRRMDAILLHNKEDIEGLASLMSFLSLDQLRTGYFTIYDMREIELDHELYLEFDLLLSEEIPVSYRLVGQCGGIEFKDGNHLILSLPVSQQKMYYFYPNYQDYYYFPLEDRAIHKSLAAYAHKENRQRCNASNCYISLEGIFLPYPERQKGYGFSVDLDESFHLPLYKKGYSQKERYVNFDDLFPEDCPSLELKDYLSSMITSIFLDKIKN